MESVPAVLDFIPCAQSVCEMCHQLASAALQEPKITHAHLCPCVLIRPFLSICYVVLQHSAVVHELFLRLYGFGMKFSSEICVGTFFKRCTMNRQAVNTVRSNFKQCQMITNRESYNNVLKLAFTPTCQTCLTYVWVCKIISLAYCANQMCVCVECLLVIMSIVPCCLFSTFLTMFCFWEDTQHLVICLCQKKANIVKSTQPCDLTFVSVKYLNSLSAQA